jgi:hypothetical protein
MKRFPGESRQRKENKTFLEQFSNNGRIIQLMLFPEEKRHIP